MERSRYFYAVEHNYSANPSRNGKQRHKFDFATSAIRKEMSIVQVLADYSQHKLYITKYLFR